MTKNYAQLREELLGACKYIKDFESFLREAPLGEMLTVSEIIELQHNMEYISKIDNTPQLTLLDTLDEITLAFTQMAASAHTKYIDRAIELAIKAGLLYYTEPQPTGWNGATEKEASKGWETLPKHLPLLTLGNNPELVAKILKQYSCAQSLNCTKLTINSATLVLVFKSHMISYTHKEVETVFPFYNGPDDQPTSKPKYLTYHLNELTNEIIDNITIGTPVQIICE